MNERHREFKVNSAAPIFAAFLLVQASVVIVQQPTATPPVEKPVTRKLRSFVTQHRGVFNGVPVEYTATVGETVLPDPTGRPAASLVSIAYIRTNEGQTGTRPVMFVFNGGPGSSSV